MNCNSINIFPNGLYKGDVNSTYRAFNKLAEKRIYKLKQRVRTVADKPE